MVKVEKVTVDEAKEVTLYPRGFPACHSGTFLLSLSHPFWFGRRGWLVQSFVLRRLTCSQPCLQLIVIDRVWGEDCFLLLQEGRKGNLDGLVLTMAVWSYRCLFFGIWEKGLAQLNELTHSYWGNTDVFGNKSISVTWKMFRLKEGRRLVDTAGPSEATGLLSQKLSRFLKEQIVALTPEAMSQMPWVISAKSLEWWRHQCLQTHQ